jgi:hypothetical protein
MKFDPVKVELQRERLQIAHSHACDVAGVTRDTARVQALIDRFPDLEDSDLLTVAYEYQCVFRDAMKACEA